MPNYNLSTCGECFLVGGFLIKVKIYASKIGPKRLDELAKGNTATLEIEGGGRATQS